MILEGPESGMWSNDQSVAATASTVTSTNVLDLGNAYAGEGEPKNVLIQVTTALASTGSATLQVKLISDSDEAFGASPQTDWDSGAIAIATLVAGYKFKLRSLPKGMKQYAKLTYTIGTETTSAGKITAGLVGDAPDDPNIWPAGA